MAGPRGRGWAGPRGRVQRASLCQGGVAWGAGWGRGCGAGTRGAGRGPGVRPDRRFPAEARPEELTPQVMVLLAQHLARHRLREPQLLEAIAHFLVTQEDQLSSKVGAPPREPALQGEGPDPTAGRPQSRAGGAGRLGDSPRSPRWCRSWSCLSGGSTTCRWSSGSRRALRGSWPGRRTRRPWPPPTSSCRSASCSACPRGPCTWSSRPPSSATSAVRAVPGEPVVCRGPSQAPAPPHRLPSRRHPAALPLPAGRGRGAGAGRLPGPPPPAPAASALVPPAPHHRPRPLQVQVAGAGGGGLAPLAVTQEPRGWGLTARTPPSPPSHKDMVAEGLRQLLGEERYLQDLTVPPGYCTGEAGQREGPLGGGGVRPDPAAARPSPTDFLLCVSSSGAVLPTRTQEPFLPYPPGTQATTGDPVQR